MIKKNKYIFYLFITTSLFIILYGKTDKIEGDAIHYLEAAQKFPLLNFDGLLPFSKRIFAPYLAGLLNFFSIQNSFYFLNIISIFVLSFSYFKFILSFKIDEKTAFLGNLLFLSNKYFIGFTSWNFYMLNDIFIEILLILLLLNLKRNNWVYFSILLFLSSLIKEHYLIMIASSLFFLLETKQLKKQIIPFIISLLPCIITYISINFLLPFRNDYSLQINDKIFELQTWFKLLMVSFLPLSLIPFIFFREVVYFFSKNKYLLLFFILSVMTALFGSNNQRLMFVSAIVFYLLITKILYKNKPKNFFISLIIICSFMNAIHYNIGEFSYLINKQLFLYINLFISILTTIIFLIIKFSPKKLD